MTEVVTELGNGAKGYREIHTDSLGVAVDRVVDIILSLNRYETYIKGINGRLVQNAGGVISELPGTWDEFIKACMNLIA